MNCPSRRLSTMLLFGEASLGGWLWSLFLWWAISGKAGLMEPGPGVYPMY